MKIIESMRRHPFRTGTAAALALGIAAAEVVGYAKNPTHDVPEGACVSLPAVSQAYVEPSTNLYLQTYTGLFTTGVVARGTVPDGAIGVRASFKAPVEGRLKWDTNASDMIKANDAGKFALKMAIGDGEVEFGVRVVAAEGSPLCNTAPEVAYEHLDRSAYLGADGTLPWPNPVAVVSNLFNRS